MAATMAATTAATTTSTLIASTLAVVVHSLWTRRHTWRSRWEIGATAAIALEGCALMLMSPWAAASLSPLLHHITGLWNLPTVGGHICLIAAAAGIVYHALVRLADERQFQELFRAHILRPVRFGVLLLVAAFLLAHEDYHPDLFAARVTSTWLAVYWLATGGLLIYLTTYAGRAILILRADPRARPTVDLYLVSAGFGVLASVAQMSGTWTDIDMAAVVWPCVCLAAAIFAYASTRSWQAKVAWFTPQRPRQPQPPAQPVPPQPSA